MPCTSYIYTAAWALDQPFGTPTQVQMKLVVAGCILELLHSDMTLMCWSTADARDCWQPITARDKRSTWC